MLRELFDLLPISQLEGVPLLLAFDLRSQDLESSGPFHSHKIILVLDLGHGDSPFGPVHFATIRWDTAVVEIVAGAGSISPQLTEVGL